jgi:hypothetical protein
LILILSHLPQCERTPSALQQVNNRTKQSGVAQEQSLTLGFKREFSSAPIGCRPARAFDDHYRRRWIKKALNL